MPGIKSVWRHKIDPRPCEHCNELFKPRSDFIRTGKGGRFCSRKCSQDWERSMKPNQSEKFWGYVAISGPDKCWIWQGFCNADGYGMLRLDGIIQRSHRYAYQDKVGEIPNGLEILHQCDTPACCNPKHLKPGTHLENMEDMARKKRSGALKGEKHYKAKIKDAQVEFIRKDYLINPEPHLEIAKRYGVSKEIIGGILNKKTFRHLLMEEEIGG